jgi:hypothetical protein
VILLIMLWKEIRILGDIRVLNFLNLRSKDMTEQIEGEDLAPTTVKQDLVRLDGIFDATQASRKVLEAKLAEAINTMKLSTDDPKVVSAQMALINTYLGLLNANESNATRRATSKLRHAEAETASKHSAAVAEMLSKLSVGNISLSALAPVEKVLSKEEMEQQFESAYETSGLAPVLDTELRTDPNDLDS